MRPELKRQIFSQRISPIEWSHLCGLPDLEPTCIKAGKHYFSESCFSFDSAMQYEEIAYNHSVEFTLTTNCGGTISEYRNTKSVGIKDWYYINGINALKTIKVQEELKMYSEVLLTFLREGVLPSYGSLTHVLHFCDSYLMGKLRAVSCMVCRTPTHFIGDRDNFTAAVARNICKTRNPFGFPTGEYEMDRICYYLHILPLPGGTAHGYTYGRQPFFHF